MQARRTEHPQRDTLSPLVTHQTVSDTVVDMKTAGLVLTAGPGCQDSTKYFSQVRNYRGTVEYRQDLNTYVISYGVPNTLDSQITLIPCNWPDATKWAGKLVTFSGRYYHATNVMIRYGGESILYVYLTSLR